MSGNGRSGMDADAAIVGAGPAGAAVATALARRGWRVVVLERRVFPRSKPCGECLNPGAVALLARLGWSDVPARLGGRPLVGWAVTAARRTRWLPFPAGVHGWAVPRLLLDEALAEAARVAGAEVRQGVAAEGLVWHRGRVIGVRTRAGELRARVVVAADGLRSPLRRAAGLAHRGPRRRRVALVGAVAAPARRSGWGELVVLPDGVVGAVEVGPGRTNVVAVAHDDACDAVRGGAAAWFDRRRAALPHLAAAPRCGPLLASGPFDYPVRRVACPGLLLVGDAAGYFDPFTGQGLAHALADALAAAAALDIALRDPSAEAAAWRVYARRVRRRRARAHRWQRLVDLGVRRPPLLAAATAALAVAPPLTHFLWRQVADLAMVDAVTP